MYVHWFLFGIGVVVHGFLLKPSDSGGQTNAQYLTVSEFFDEKRQQQHDLDRTIALLTSQIEQKFTDLEQKCLDRVKINVTLDTFNLTEQKYTELAENYTKLQAKFEALNSQYTVQNTELALLKNRTIANQANIEELHNLKNIQPLVNLNTLQQQLQSVSAQTHTLSVNEQARSQDFLALYNETLFSKRKIADIEAQTKTLQNYDNEQALKIDVLNKTIQAVVFSDNRTFSQMQNKMDTITERVAIAGCLTGGNKEPNGYIIPFSDIKHHVGIRNISIFQSTGKFTCEKEGLYLISVTVTTYEGYGNYGAYSVYRNGIAITSRAMHTHYGYSSVSAIITLELNLSDTVWVQTDTTMYIERAYSCLSIVKIK